jgi:bifunctional non-homologous end joining protein LigD
MSRAAVQRPPARFDAKVLPGAKPAPFPGFIESCHPTRGGPFGWGLGSRDQVRRLSGRRSTCKRPSCHLLAEGARPDAALSADRRCAGGPPSDGPDPGRRSRDSRFAGRARFGLLHADLAAGRKDRLLYYAFNLLYLDDFDLRGVRLAERKRILAELLVGASERILYAEHLQGDGAEIYARACAMGLEGIVSKQQDAPYRSGRVESWIKVKCGKRDTFPIVAFVEKLGAKP